MARPIVLSNGELHVGINNYGAIHDFYYPYVGLENHAAGAQLRHKIGVFVDGELSWTDEDPRWSFTYRYPHGALVGTITARNKALGVSLELDDAVDATFSAFMRNIHIINHHDSERTIRLFTYQAFAIGDSRSNTDTAQFLPGDHAILHYRGRRAFIISGTTDTESFDQHGIGVFGIEGREGSYRDADDGELSGNNVDHGKVDSILRFSVTLAAKSSDRIHYWIAAGTSTREALYIHNKIKQQGVQARLHRTANWWQEWLEPAHVVAEKLPEEYRESFIQSVMIIKSQIDKRGAVIASTDSSILNYSRDSYAYAWPRDGAYTVWPLLRMGYYDEAYQFFSFCQKGLHPDGYLLHKYRADGAPGSSWHPYVHDGEVAPPLQEDETAVTLFVFSQFYQLTKNNTLIKDFYQSLVKPMANFLADFIDPKTGLPKPSYDLWEEVYLTTTYTTAITYGALIAAAELAHIAGDKDSAVKWQAAAADMQTAAHTHLFNEARGVFYKGVRMQGDTLTHNETIDASSIYGAYMYGLFQTESHQMQSSMKVLRQTFSVSNEAPGTPRYENDGYRRTSSDYTGNWWCIPTLWNAQYAFDKGDTESALQVLNWIKNSLSQTGMLGEQIHPRTNEVLAPLPLTWSHAEYISTLIDSIGK